MSAVLHVPVMQLYCFGMGNQLLLLYMDAPFLQPRCFWRQISIFFVYLDAKAQHLLENHDIYDDVEQALTCIYITVF